MVAIYSCCKVYELSALWILPSLVLPLNNYTLCSPFSGSSLFLLWCHISLT